ncbi:unnamed protein product [Ostreobium quekettii]|uniref:Serine carboxypeptidase n=1 Tax=Ostreobium quekettii TaxID=121088 RepID=A0A8S1J8I4_9CHLO|nr:unnamed protein product [Ostreobium quekettii]
MAPLWLPFKMASLLPAVLMAFAALPILLLRGAPDVWEAPSLDLRRTKATIEVEDETEVLGLPGWKRPLPSRHYAGYITVDEDHGRRLFYYFATSERSPTEDPVVLWLNGGPGCSSMDGFVYEHGPFQFEYSDGRTHITGANPFAWTKVANVIYLDSPSGVGMSYSDTAADYNVDDNRTAHDSNVFLRIFFQRYPNFQSNVFFISGESFGGIYVPMLTHEVVRGNEAGEKPYINLKGYLVGNGVTDPEVDNNAVPAFAADQSLVSQRSYEAMLTACQGNPYKHRYDQVCQDMVGSLVYPLYSELNFYDILDVCLRDAPDNNRQAKTRSVFKNVVLKLLEDGLRWPLGGVIAGERAHNWKTFAGYEAPCLDYWTAESWFNNETVREALHAPSVSTTGSFYICTDRINYTHDVPSMIPIHRDLIEEKGLHALIYSGDHDMSVPHTGSEAWVYGMGFPATREWDAWMDDDEQVAGYTVEFGNLVFATVKGAGHMVPQYKPVQALLMFSRFLERKTVHKASESQPTRLTQTRISNVEL